MKKNTNENKEKIDELKIWVMSNWEQMILSVVKKSKKFNLDLFSNVQGRYEPEPAMINLRDNPIDGLISGCFKGDHSSNKMTIEFNKTAATDEKIEGILIFKCSKCGNEIERKYTCNTLWDTEIAKDLEPYRYRTGHETEIKKIKEDWLKDFSESVKKVVSQVRYPDAICTGPSYYGAIRIENEIKSFGNTLKKMNTIKKITIKDSKDDYLLILVTPDQSFDKEFESQGVMVYHPLFKGHSKMKLEDFMN